MAFQCKMKGQRNGEEGIRVGAKARGRKTQGRVRRGQEGKEDKNKLKEKV